MGLLDYSRSNPWVSDALATISQGLLSYGSGNQNTLAQLPQFLAERQRYRKDDQRQAKMDQRQEQIWQQQQEERQRTQNQEAARKQAWLNLSQGQAQPMAGGTNPAQRGLLSDNAPTMPRSGGLLDSFDPQIAGYLQSVGQADPGAAMSILGDQLFKETEPTKWVTEKVREGDQDVTYLINPITLEKQKLGSGSAFAAPQAPQAPEKVRLAQAAGLTPGTPEYNKFLLGNAPDPAKDVDTFAKVNTMVKPYVDSAINMSKQVSQIDTALNQQNGTGDIAAIIAFNKLLDEGAVVRESDVALTQSAQGVLDQMKAWQANAREGDIMPQTLRDKLRATAKAFHDAGQKYSKARVEGFKSMAEGANVNFGQIVTPGLEQLLGWSAPMPPSGGPPAIDADEVLRRVR